MANDVDTAAEIVREICMIEDKTDGVVFDADTVAPVVIKEDADYEGVRVTFLGHLQSARINMQIDMGFGDVVEPEPEMLTYPTILDHSAPQIRGYPTETVVAEKFQAMVQLGQLNSRIRDFYDIWSMSRQFEFNGNDLEACAGKYVLPSRYRDGPESDRFSRSVHRRQYQAEPVGWLLSKVKD